MLSTVLGRGLSGDLRPGTLLLRFDTVDLPPAETALLPSELQLLPALRQEPPPPISDFLRRNGSSRCFWFLAPLPKTCCSRERSGSTGGKTTGEKRDGFDRATFTGNKHVTVGHLSLPPWTHAIDLRIGVHVSSTYEPSDKRHLWSLQICVGRPHIVGSCRFGFGIVEGISHFRSPRGA